MKKLKIPYDCCNADGSENAAGKIMNKVSLKIKFRTPLDDCRSTRIVTYKDCPPECMRTVQINAAESTEVTKPPDYVKPYRHLFEKKEFDKLPPHRDWDHEINLTNDALKDLPAKVYPMTQTELQTLDEFLEEGL
ncbi:hypothetical protein AX17_007132 [Amanita inopinata Kibby_2008]|nr:hypothetical protein AX17_007132 [Amanita inopinata Kibby_2008]